MGIKMEIKKNLYWCGVLDSELRVFDIIMMTEFGTTYNSYILKGSEKTALFETVKLKFFDEYIESLGEVCDVKKIDYLVVNHTEPDHAGSIEKLIELNPNLKIVGTPTAITFLKNIVNREFYSIAVKENDELSLGDKMLKFMVLPNLHWPDTMYTYVEEDKVLFTCDSFGSHYSHSGILRSTVTDTEGYMRATKYYFDNIIGPFINPYMKNALKRIDGLPIEMICTGHGPVLDSHIDEIMMYYKEWCGVSNPNVKKTVVMPYVSAYGYTKQLAEKIGKGIGDSGDIDVRLYDMVNSDAGVVLGEIANADGLMFGTPTIVGEALKPIWNLTTSMYAPVHKGKLASAFGSYGWSGEGVPNIIERLRQLKLKVLDGFRVRFKPSDNDLIDAYEFGYNFGCVLQNKDNDRKKAADGKLVKCLVCGEIFDASIGVCPVCGAGRESFIEVDTAATGFMRDTDERYVILGSGAAAYNAAKAIRECNSTCSIVIITNESVLPYNRPMLTKAMLADFESGQMAIVESEWYVKKNVSVILNKKITDIDTEYRKIGCDDGSKFMYDKLIYALGAECFVPPYKGAELPEVIAIRDIRDVREIQALLPVVKRVAVIGGGVLGLEAAWELKKSKCEVTVFEAAPQIMGRQIDAAAAGLIGDILSEYSIKLNLDAKISEIVGRDQVEGVKLEDGTLYPVDLVIVSCGIRPNTTLAQKAGISTGRSVFVDERMQTNIEDIYACGDCAEYMGINYGLWSQAIEMGRVAGLNAAGADAVYSQVDGALTFNGFNTSLFALGDVGKKPGKKYKTVEFSDSQKKNYEKYYFLNNRLSGVILIGDISKMVKLTDAVKNNVQFKELF